MIQANNEIFGCNRHRRFTTNSSWRRTHYSIGSRFTICSGKLMVAGVYSNTNRLHCDTVRPYDRNTIRRYNDTTVIQYDNETMR